MGVHGWGQVMSWRGGMVTSTAILRLADSQWFNAMVPVRQETDSSLDEKPLAAEPAGFPVSPFPTLCHCALTLKMVSIPR